MYRLPVFTVVGWSLILAASCSTNNRTGAPAEPGSSADSPGKATFSAVVDGVPVSGGAIDPLQQRNAAYTVPGSDGRATQLLFWLVDAKTADASQFTYAIRLSLPKQNGVAAPAYIHLSINLDRSHSAVYDSEGATVNITGLTPTRLTGEFSGTFNLSPDTPNVPKKKIVITNGKFDIPFATSRVIPS